MAYIPDELLNHPQITLNALLLYTRLKEKGCSGDFVDVKMIDLGFRQKKYVVKPRDLLIRLGFLEFQHARGKSSKYRLTRV